MYAFIALVLVAVATAQQAPLLKNSEPIPGKYIIKLKDEFNVNEIATTVRLSGGKVGSLWRSALNGFAAELSDDLLRVVRNLPAVEYVEQDGVYRTQVTWGIDRVDQRDLPLDNFYSPSGSGTGYTVYVIDTGVLDTHNEFSGRARQLVNYAGGRSDTDCNGHGTHCAGTVGSNTYGVAKGVQIRGVKVLGCLGSGSTSGVVDGIEYVQDHANALSVASMSLGGGASTTLDNAVNTLVNSGVPTAVAAGNDNGLACNSSPANAANAITVGATDSSDARSSFSNYGTCVDIFAPGSSITSTWHTSNSATNTISGTSMACPHVAGGIALYGKNTEAMLDAATNGRISNVMESPNKLLYV